MFAIVHSTKLITISTHNSKAEAQAAQRAAGNAGWTYVLPIVNGKVCW